jgi:hypothetical protein
VVATTQGRPKAGTPTCDSRRGHVRPYAPRATRDVTDHYPRGYPNGRWATARSMISGSPLPRHHSMAIFPHRDAWPDRCANAVRLLGAARQRRRGPDDEAQPLRHQERPRRPRRRPTRARGDGRPRRHPTVRRRPHEDGPSSWSVSSTMGADDDPLHPLDPRPPTPPRTLTWPRTIVAVDTFRGRAWKRLEMPAHRPTTTGRLRTDKTGETRCLSTIQDCRARAPADR